MMQPFRWSAHQMGAFLGRSCRLSLLIPSPSVRAIVKTRAQVLPRRVFELQSLASASCHKTALGPRPRLLNAKRENNPVKQVASDARTRNAPDTKSGSFNCARKNRRSNVPTALMFTHRAFGARGPKQGLSFAPLSTHYVCLR